MLGLLKGWRYVEHMWEQVKRARVESGREMCGSVKGVVKEP